MKRFLLGLAGATILCVSAIATLGTALAAPLGMLAARQWARRRGEVLTTGRSWLAAAVASSLAIAGAYTVAVLREPNATLRQFEESAARREAAPTRPPPGWMRYVLPQTTRRPSPAAERILKSRAFTLYTTIIGAGLVVAIFGAISGRLGWAGTVLLGRAFSRPPDTRG
jgi:hypothetical protein